jgi:hypothetical protein
MCERDACWLRFAERDDAIQFAADGLADERLQRLIHFPRQHFAKQLLGRRVAVGRHVADESIRNEPPERQRRRNQLRFVLFQKTPAVRETDETDHRTEEM